MKRSKEHNLKISIALKGRTLSKEHVKALRANQPDRSGVNNSMYGKKRPDLAAYNRSEKHHEACRASEKVKNKTEETRKKFSLAAMRRAIQIKVKEQLRQNGIKAMKMQGGRPSKAEYILEAFFKEKNIKFESQYSYKLGIADFYLPDRNLIVECNGSYWHSLPNVKERDKRKYKWLKENGYKLLILISEDITSKGWKGDKFFQTAEASTCKN